MPEVNLVPGELNKDYIVVRSDVTVPKGTKHTPYGPVYPGQGADGYGAKIFTDLVLQFAADLKCHRVYATCYSNAASHWILINSEKKFLPTVFQDEIRSEFFSGKTVKGDVSPFNDDLQWLAETVGVQVHAVASNKSLAGAIFGRLVPIVEGLIERMKPGEKIKAVKPFETATVKVSRLQMLTFVGVDKSDTTKPWQLVVSNDQVEFNLDMWDFVRNFATPKLD